MLIWNHKRCRQLLPFAHLLPGEWAWPWSYGLCDRDGFWSFVDVFGFSQQIICCFIVRKWVLWKASPKDSGDQCRQNKWKELCVGRKEISKRLFEALLEQVIGRNLWPVGFPGYQQKRWLSVLRNKRNPRGSQGLPVTHISELREEWISSSPGIELAACGQIPSPNSSAEGEGCQWKQNLPSDPSSGHSKDFRFATRHGLGCQESYNMSETL